MGGPALQAVRLVTKGRVATVAVLEAAAFVRLASPLTGTVWITAQRPSVLVPVVLSEASPEEDAQETVFAEGIAVYS